MDKMRPTLKYLCLLVNSVNPVNHVNPACFFCPNVVCFDLAARAGIVALLRFDDDVA
jgi:hypothetical protein